jgi:hypothetical protein
LVRALACQARGRGFESRTSRHSLRWSAGVSCPRRLSFSLQTARRCPVGAPSWSCVVCSSESSARPSYGGHYWNADTAWRRAMKRSLPLWLIAMLVLFAAPSQALATAARVHCTSTGAIGTFSNVFVLDRFGPYVREGYPDQLWNHTEPAYDDGSPPRIALEIYEDRSSRTRSRACGWSALCASRRVRIG